MGVIAQVFGDLFFEAAKPLHHSRRITALPANLNALPPLGNIVNDLQALRVSLLIRLNGSTARLVWAGIEGQWSGLEVFKTQHEENTFLMRFSFVPSRWRMHNA